MLTLYCRTELIMTLLNDGTHSRTGVQLLKPDTVRGGYPRYLHFNVVL